MGKTILAVALLALPLPVLAGETTRYVDGSVPSSGDGTTWATAFKSIQEGIDAASDGDTVIVAEGTYLDIQFHGKNITLRSTDPVDPNVVAKTIIDGNWSWCAVTFRGNEGAGCVLSGFTIRNGLQEVENGGGGIYGGGTRAGIVYNRIINNGALGSGGGLYDCDGTIAKNIIAGNGSPSGGGLADCDGTIELNVIVGSRNALLGCSGVISKNKILSNSGGALYDCSGIIEGNIVAGNWMEASEESGGGLCQCKGTIRNNLIVGNWATWRGGGIAFSEGLLLNNTIAANQADMSGGGIADWEGTIVNCVIWGNRSPDGTQLYDSGDPKYSCVEDWTGGGEGNTSEDPLFAGWPLDTGTWTENATFNGESFKTTLFNTGASWETDSLEGLFVNPDMSQPLQFFITSNTTKTITVWGDTSEMASRGDAYEIYDYRLRPDSPCMDAGDNSVGVGRFDLDGNYRRICTTGKAGWSGDVDYIVKEEGGAVTFLWKGFIDMGAYECQAFGEVPETFAIYSRERMESGDWTQVFTGNVCTWTDLQAAGEQKLYRVEMR